MTTTMNKSKLRGNPDGSSGSIVITADTEAEAEAEAEAEGRGQTADSRQQTQTPKKRRGITAPPLTKLRGIKVFSALISLQTDPQLMVLKVERIAAGRAVRNIPLRIT